MGEGLKKLCEWIMKGGWLPWYLRFAKSDEKSEREKAEKEKKEEEEFEEKQEEEHEKLEKHEERRKKKEEIKEKTKEFFTAITTLDFGYFTRPKEEEEE